MDVSYTLLGFLLLIALLVCIFIKLIYEAAKCDIIIKEICEKVQPGCTIEVDEENNIWTFMLYCRSISSDIHINVENDKIIAYKLHENNSYENVVKNIMLLPADKCKNNNLVKVLLNKTSFDMDFDMLKTEFKNNKLVLVDIERNRNTKNVTYRYMHMSNV